MAVGSGVTSGVIVTAGVGVKVSVGVGVDGLVSSWAKTTAGENNRAGPSDWKRSITLRKTRKILFMLVLILFEIILRVIRAL